LQIHEFELIEKTLLENEGNRQKVAALLGVSERTLRYKLAKMREEGYTV
jgi:two-component system response regulator FlrC